ncbi:hypothetical protein U3D69_004731 [Salmonella enterica]|nr:hypothetical protein [Salmonella enterica]ELX6092173.1 hypothetical protein [Salmonella enterica]EMA5188338.1 hypothetical protein [Salmonella enterica]
MAKIYQFPQGEERGKFRKEIARERKKRFAVKTGNTFVKWLGWGWFYLRLLAASVLHFISVFVLAILGAFKGLVFWLGGVLCIITWYHLDHQLWTPQNLTIPVIAATWITGLLAEPLIELLNNKMPWYRLLVPDAKDTSSETTNDDQL